MNSTQYIRAKNTGMFPSGFLRSMSSKTTKAVSVISPSADTKYGQYMSTFYKKRFTLLGTSYPTMEHAYQAMKFKYFSDNPVLWMKFRCGGSIKTAEKAKWVGSDKGLKDIGVHVYKEDWNNDKHRIFRKIVEARMKHDKKFEKILLAHPCYR